MIKFRNNITEIEQTQRDGYLNFIDYIFKNNNLIEIKLKEPKYVGGVARFKDLDFLTLKKLIELGYIDLEEKHNKAPTISEFLEFMKNNPEYLAFGYTVDQNRDDCRISIKGVEHNGSFNSNSKKDFYKLFFNADELLFNSETQFCLYK